MAPPQLGLFGDPPAGAEVAPAAPSVEARTLAARLPPGLRIGTSSWSFPGWAGIVYHGRHSEAELARRGLAAYARHPLLRAAGIDRTFYAPLEARELAAYADAVPEDFRFQVKAPEAIVTAFRRPRPAGAPSTAPAARGEPNPRFLDPDFAAEAFVGPVVEGLGARTGPLVLQFPQQPRADLGDPEVFAARLHDFLRRLPRGPLYAVELRDARLLTPAYAAALADTGTCHCTNVHPRMPGPGEQRDRVPAAAGAPLVVRWMLGAGLRYEEARVRYAPFDRLQAPDAGSRSEIASLCAATLAAGGEATVVINNKAEGSAPLSAFALAAEVDALRA